MSVTPEKFVMPNGAVVWYRDSDHQYNSSEKFTRNTRIAGVSTVSKCDGDNNSDPLIDWGVRLDREGVAREASLGLSLDDADDMRAALSWLESGESIGQTLKQEKLTWRDLRHEAGTRGSLSHDVLQSLAEGKTPEVQSGYDRAVVHWWESRQPEPILVEQVVYSELEKFAGRFDLLCKINGQTVLCDLKTSKWASNSFAVQLNLYLLAGREAGLFQNVDRLAIIQVREDGTFRELDVPLNSEWALSALCTYRNGKAIGAALRASKKAAEEQTLADASELLRAA